MIDFTADEILAIPADRPEQLFTNNAGAARAEFIELGKIWHPDVNKSAKATDVFQHIAALYARAKERIGTAFWKGENRLLISVGKGHARKIRIIDYFNMRPFELGEMYIGHNDVAYSVKHEYADLVRNAHRWITSFTYSSSRMEKEVARYLPQHPELYRTKERMILVVPKQKDLILLADLVKHYGKLDPRHVAWIQSSIHNLACYLSYAGIMHGDISPDTYFVSPSDHSGALLGGWWYATKRGSKMSALPQRSLLNCPPLMLRTKQASRRLDLELIRLTGREILGCSAGDYWHVPAIPKALGQWMNGVTTGDPVTDYQLWKDVLKVSFGDPKFVELHIDAATVYGVRKEKV